MCPSLEQVSRPRIPVILGPTAVGKTAAGILIAEAMNGEIISADSRQLYRMMNIGSAKPSIEELDRVPHHMIDIADPDETFSAGEFARQACQAVVKIIDSRKLPIVVGGAGLYIQAMAEGLFSGKSSDTEIRKRLKKEYDERGAESLFEELKNIDPEYAQIVHMNDKKKLLRALEIYRVTGMTVSELGGNQSKGYIEPVYIGLTGPRDWLYDRIEQRVEWMLANGVLEEVIELRRRGYGRELNSMNSPGYREVFQYLDDEIEYDRMLELIQRNTRRYAKRQMTWFRRLGDKVEWFAADREPDIIAEEIVEYLKKQGFN